MWRLFKDGHQVRRNFLRLQVIWLAVVVASAGINYFYSQREFKHSAQIEMRAAFRRDLDFRRWLSSIGGVYAPVSERVQPNPLLAHLPDRDLNKPDGTRLTLVTSNSILRLVNDSTQSADRVRTRPVSQRPLLAKNLPDGWEAAALHKAKSTGEEVTEFTSIAGAPFLRLLWPLKAEESCRKCHPGAGYRLGEIFGGLSVALPLTTELTEHRRTVGILFSLHLAIYLLGVFFLFRGQGLVARRVRERDGAMASLRESEEKFRTMLDYTYAWEYWLNPDGSFRYVSPSVLALTGYPPERFLAEPEFIKELIVDDDRALLHHHLEQEEKEDGRCEVDFRLRTATGEVRWVRHICRTIYGPEGANLGRRASNYDITAQKEAEQHREELIVELQGALEKVKLLSGFLPICANCKKIRDDRGYWNQIEEYISKHSNAVFSHGICPECRRQLYPELDRDE